MECSFSKRVLSFLQQSVLQKRHAKTAGMTSETTDKNHITDGHSLLVSLSGALQPFYRASIKIFVY